MALEWLHGIAVPWFSISLTIFPFYLHSFFFTCTAGLPVGVSFPIGRPISQQTNICDDGLCISGRKFHVHCFVVWPWLKSNLWKLNGANLDGRFGQHGVVFWIKRREM
jgi:hypothetical protein